MDYVLTLRRKRQTVTYLTKASVENAARTQESVVGEGSLLEVSPNGYLTFSHIKTLT